MQELLAKRAFWVRTFLRQPAANSRLMLLLGRIGFGSAEGIMERVNELGRTRWFGHLEETLVEHVARKRRVIQFDKIDRDATHDALHRLMHRYIRGPFLEQTLE